MARKKRGFHPTMRIPNRRAESNIVSDKKRSKGCCIFIHSIRQKDKCSTKGNETRSRKTGRITKVDNNRIIGPTKKKRRVYKPNGIVVKKWRFAFRFFLLLLLLYQGYDAKPNQKYRESGPGELPHIPASDELETFSSAVPPPPPSIIKKNQRN